MFSKSNLEPESAYVKAAEPLGHDIAEFCGEWIDAIWEAGNEDPTRHR